jgi:2'-5' RNA ligase
VSYAPAESAIFVAIRAPMGIDRLRRRHDPSAALGVPAHVTLLYPFVPPSDLTPAVRARLVRVVGSHPAFGVTFATVGRFPDCVWLAPHPALTFVRLIDAVSDAFPGYPPYGGLFDTVIPHLTVAQNTDPDLLATVDAALVPRLPISARVTHITVAATRPDGRWRLRWRLPLGPPTTGG